MKKHLYIVSFLVILALCLAVFGQTGAFEILRLRGTGRPGQLVVANDKNAAVIVLRGSDGQISSGGNGTPGRLRIANAQNAGVLFLDGETGRISFTGGGGIKFADGTVQKTAQLEGPKGERGFKGDKGDRGEKGEPAPPGLAHTIAVCQTGAPVECPCGGGTVTRVFGTCNVTSDTGSCSNITGNGCCAVCR